MRSLAFPAVLFAAVADIVSATVVTPHAIGSSITQLFQNNLNYTDDKNHIGALLLEPMSLADATKACVALGESLLPLATATAHAADIAPELLYLSYEGVYSATQAYWVGSSTAIVRKGSTSIGTVRTSSKSHLPVLCTQSSTATTDPTSIATKGNEISVSSNFNTFVGYRNLKSFRFLGIPYANHVNRWEYSTVYSAKNQVVNTTAFGPQCYQLYTTGFSEQCLFLNVFTPYLPNGVSRKTKLKPVVFWIHGGAFTSGTGADPTADGGNMASRGDVVVVTINYRLSTLGFLALPGTSIKGNYGLADQIIALEWVRANIAAFGGDKNRITIYGQSAGAGSVRALIGSPQAIGKFAAAIPGSNLDGIDYAATYSNYYTPAQEATIAGNAIVNATNCTNASPSAVVSCLSKVDPLTLVSLSTVARYVIVDGKYVTSSELQVVKKGHAAHVPTLWGTMADDAGPFIGYPYTATNASQAIMSLNYLSANLTAAIFNSGLFPVPNTGNFTLDLYNVSARVATDIQFRCLDQATVYSAVKHDIFADSWYYEFDRAYQTPGYDPNKPVCDAPITPSHPYGDPSLPYFKCHSGDLYYEFGTLGQFDYPYRDGNDLTFTQLIMDYWTSFVRTHNPNPDPAYLATRGYSSTIEQIAKSGYWKPVTKSDSTSRRLAIPSTQGGFREIKQCEVLGFPLNYYETEQGSK